MNKPRPSTHPGEILKEEFAKPLGLTQERMSKDLDIGIKTLSEIYNGKRGISPLMALKLSKYFGTSYEFWMNLQSSYDAYKAYGKHQEAIEKITCCCA